jgi:hypothetical protein
MNVIILHTPLFVRVLGLGVDTDCKILMLLFVSGFCYDFIRTTDLVFLIIVRYRFRAEIVDYKVLFESPISYCFIFLLYIVIVQHTAKLKPVYFLQQPHWDWVLLAVQLVISCWRAWSGLWNYLSSRWHCWIYCIGFKLCNGEGKPVKYIYLYSSTPA